MNLNELCPSEDVSANSSSDKIVINNPAEKTILIPRDSINSRSGNRSQLAGSISLVDPRNQ